MPALPLPSPLPLRVLISLVISVAALSDDAEAAGGFEPLSGGTADTLLVRPNIVLFLVDDMGWQDTSVPFHTARTPFNDRYRTPAMERLADQGVRFSQAYSASPVCTPTRTSILTGKHPGRTHITNWTLRNGLEEQETGPKDYPLHSPDWNFTGLGPDDVTLPALLRDAGYRTIHVGKAHFGALGTPGADPTTLGFDVNVAGHAAGGPGSFYGEHHFSAAHRGGDRVWDVPGLEKYHGTSTNLTEALTIEANEVVTEAVEAGRPFFLYLSHYTVHAPIMADSGYIHNYSDLDPIEGAYASMVEAMDASLGAVLAHLERLGIAEETLVLFMSDNGGLSAHARGGAPHVHNAPLRSGKGSAYEGGIRVPMIVSWARPDARSALQAGLPIRSGVIHSTPVMSQDFFPSILNLAGLQAPEAHRSAMDGQCFVPLLTGEEPLDRVGPLGWHYPHKWGPEGPGLDPFTAVREGDWKMIFFYKDRIWELYNLADDLGERFNLVDREPETAERMAALLRGWMDEIGAQVPLDQGSRTPVARPEW